MSAYYCLHLKNWHRVDVGNGQVEGLCKARFAYSKRGKLYIKGDGAIPQEALRDGNRLAFIRASQPQPHFNSTSVQTVEKVDASIQTSPTPMPVQVNINDKRSDTTNLKQAKPRSVKRRNSIPYDPDVPPTKKRRLSYNVPQLTKNDNLVKDIKKAEHHVLQKKNLKHLEKLEIITIRKPETKPKTVSLDVNDEDIDLIRSYLMNTCDSFDLLQFDQGGNYQIQCLILFTPLVILERCPEISRMLDKKRQQSEDEISQKDFVSHLGLKAVQDQPSPKRYRMRQAIRQNTNQDTRLKTDKEIKVKNMVKPTSKSKGNEYTTESESDSETEFRKQIRKKTRNVTKLAKKSVTPRKIITRNISSQSKDSDTDSLFPDIRHSARLIKKKHKPTITSNVESDQENINKAQNKSVDLTNCSDDSDETNDKVENNNNKRSDNNIQMSSKKGRFLKTTRSLNTLEPKIKPVSSAENDKKTINETKTGRKLLKANKSRNIVSTNSEDEFVIKPKQNRKNRTVHADNPQDLNRNLPYKPNDNNNNLTDDENSDKEFHKPVTRSRPNGKLDMDYELSPKPLAQSSKNATIQSLDSNDDMEIQEVKKNKIIDKIKSITARRLSTSSSMQRVEYSSLEDHAIVAWVSCGGRARCVNGNRIWRELEEDYHKITGQNRSWHSLRNRYLRSILLRLESMALDPIQVRRLRAAASTGEIKARAPTARRNSIFGVPVRGALSRRAQRSPSEEIMPSKRHKHDGRRQVSPPARALRSSITSPDKNKRSPRYSEITRRFVANHKDASDSSTPASREISPVLDSTRNVAKKSRNVRNASPKSDDMFPESEDLSLAAKKVTRNSVQTKMSLRNSMVTKETETNSLETNKSKETEDKRKSVRIASDTKSSSPNKMANSSPRRKSQRNRSVSPEVSKPVKTRRKSLKDKFEESKLAKTRHDSPEFNTPVLDKLKSSDAKINRRNSLREDGFDLTKSLARNLARRSLRTMSVDVTKVVTTKSKENSIANPTASTSKFVKSVTNDESKLQRKNDQQNTVATKSRTRKLYNPTGFL